MANGISTGNPVVSIKDVVQSSVKVPNFDKHLKKARRYNRPKRCGNYNKDEVNSLKTLNDKNICIRLNIWHNMTDKRVIL